MTASTATSLLLGLSFLKGVGSRVLKAIASHPDLHHVEADRAPDSIAALLGNPSVVAWKDAQGEACRQIDRAAEAGARVVSVADPEYPALLAATPDDPAILFVKGNFAQPSAGSVAVIGTRNPTAHGIVIAGKVTGFLAEQGCSIVSGLAIGCDFVAHRTALDMKAHTVAVLAHGLHTVAPPRHRDLADEIVASGGALVTEYRFGQDVQKHQYVKRDRIQAGLAIGVVMIQSDVFGGSLHATRAALDYGRWIAVPYPTAMDLEADEPKIKGNLLIAEGADEQRISVLRCSRDALGRILVLRSRADYERMLDGLPGRAVSEIPASSSGKGPTLEPESLQAKRYAAVFMHTNSVETVSHRLKTIRTRIQEVELMLQLLRDEGTSIAPHEVKFELETLLLQMKLFARDAKQLLLHDLDLYKRIVRFYENVVAVERGMEPTDHGLGRRISYQHVHDQVLGVNGEFRQLAPIISDALSRI